MKSTNNPIPSLKSYDINFLGHYRWANTIEFQIRELDDGLILQLEGLDKEFQFPLHYLSPKRYRFGLQSAIIEFVENDLGEFDHFLWDGIPSYRVEAEDSLPAPFLPQPKIEITEDKRQNFMKLLNSSASKDGTLQYILSYPKYEFLAFLSRECNYIFHGSPNTDIEVFHPHRETIDSSAHGNVMGVYGTTDPIWPLFFAIVDRRDHPFRIVSSPMKFITADHATHWFYLFAIGEEALQLKPFTTGMIYIFDRSSFSIVSEGDPEEAEWACTGSVRPLYKLPVNPIDFPFLTQIHPHRLTKKQRELQEIRDNLFRVYKSVKYETDVVRFTYHWSEMILIQITRYIQLEHRFNPWMQFKLEITSTHEIEFIIAGATHLPEEIQKKIDNLQNQTIE